MKYNKQDFDFFPGKIRISYEKDSYYNVEIFNEKMEKMIFVKEHPVRVIIGIKNFFFYIYCLFSNSPEYFICHIHDIINGEEQFITSQDNTFIEIELI